MSRLGFLPPLREKEPYLPTISRTCSKCGEEFKTDDRKHRCFKCRKPIINGTERRKLDSICNEKHLTSREISVIKLIQEGKGNKEIAETLHLAVGTIKVYLSYIYIKVGVKNRTQLALRFIGKEIKI